MRYVTPVCHAVVTTSGLKTACSQIEHIEINYDAHTNTGRTHPVCQYDTFFNKIFKNFDILLKNATEIGVIKELSVQNLDHTWSTRPHKCVQVFTRPTLRGPCSELILRVMSHFSRIVQRYVEFRKKLSSIRRFM